MKMDWEQIEELIDQIAEKQSGTMYKVGKQVVPNLVPDDMLQPNDFLELETDPLFRYEEGVLTGIQTVQMALRALRMDFNYDKDL